MRPGHHLRRAEYVLHAAYPCQPSPDEYVWQPGPSTIHQSQHDDRRRPYNNSFFQTVVVTSTTSTILSLTTTVVISTSVNTPQLNRGLIIESEERVQVTYRLTPTNNQDIITLKDRAGLGYAFYAASQTRLSATNNTFDERHFVSVVATEATTVVTFRSPIALRGVTAALNTPFSVTLGAGQTYTTC